MLYTKDNMSGKTEIEYVIQKYVTHMKEWTDVIVYSEDEYDFASSQFQAYTDHWTKSKFRLIMRATTITEEEVLEEIF